MAVVAMWLEAVLALRAMEAMLAETELQAFAIVDEQPNSY